MQEDTYETGSRNQNLFLNFHVALILFAYERMDSIASGFMLNYVEYLHFGTCKSMLRLNAAIVDTHRCARVLTGAKQCYFTTGKSPLFVLFIFVCSILHVISK